MIRVLDDISGWGRFFAFFAARMFFFFLALFAVVRAVFSEASPRPNIILIMCDDMGFFRHWLLRGRSANSSLGSVGGGRNAVHTVLQQRQMYDYPRVDFNGTLSAFRQAGTLAGEYDYLGRGNATGRIPDGVVRKVAFAQSAGSKEKHCRELASGF